MENRKALLEVSHLAKRYKNAEPLTDVNCKVYEGEVISIIGPSGTGKSTLLTLLENAMGDYYGVAESSLLTTRTKHASQMHQPAGNTGSGRDPL